MDGLISVAEVGDQADALRTSSSCWESEFDWDLSTGVAEGMCLIVVTGSSCHAHNVRGHDTVSGAKVEQTQHVLTPDGKIGEEFRKMKADNGACNKGSSTPYVPHSA